MRGKILHRKELQGLAKLLNYVLGARPDEFGLLPDTEGFVSLKELLQALKEEQEWRFLNRGHINELLHGGYRRDLEIVGERIRSTDPRTSWIPRPAADLPERLYCAVRRRAHAVALEKGLKASPKSWIVLSRTQELALRRGRRKDTDAVLIQVKAKEAFERGVRFYSTQGELFLAEEIPVEFLLGPPVKQERKPQIRAELRKETTVDPSWGSFFPDLSAASSGRRPSASLHKAKDPLWRRERRKKGRR